MGATLDSLIAGENIDLDYVIAIEGYPYLLTTGDPDAAVTAWSGTDWALALGGLEINWAQHQELDPWNSFAPGSSLVFKVMDFDGSDTFGVDVHKREGGTASRIAADLGPEDTSIVVQRSDDFPAGIATAYLGTEAFVYTTNTTATETFSGVTRGAWSPFPVEGGGRFARSHKITPVADGVPPAATAATMVRTHPTEWMGKWVGVWIHANRGGVLDTKAEAHLAFAGRIAAPFRDTPEGLTVVSCDDVRQTILDTVILKHQLKARLKEGIYLFANNDTVKFDCYTKRVDSGTNVTTVKNADPLRVVSSGAAGAYQIDEGWYTIEEIASAINAWLAQALVDTDCLYRLSYNANAMSDNGQRASLRLDDPTDGAVGDVRYARVTCNNQSIRKALGWEWETVPGGISVGDTDQPTQTEYSVNPPARVQGDWVPYETTSQLRLEKVTGEFVDQLVALNATMQQQGFGRGVLRIGDDLFVCDVPSITNGEGTVNVRRIRELDQAIGSTPDKIQLTVEDSGDIQVTQILVLEGTPQSLVMMLLCSTGSQFYNSALFDQLPAQCGAGIPWSLLTADFEDELAAAPGGTEPMTIVVDEPTSLPDLLNVSFILRNLSLIWRQGRLALRGWATPTSAATLEFTDADKATPIDMADADNQRSIAELTDKWLRNVIQIRYNRDLASDSYRDTYNVIGVDGGWGEKRRTLEARNAVRGGGFLAGENIDGLIATFVGGLSFLTRHAHIVRVPVSYKMFETHTPGEIVLFTDTHLRDPATGLRGVVGKPALIVGQSYEWGGPAIGINGRDPDTQETHGTIDLMLFPQMSLAPYCPTARVDSSVTGGGFDAGYDAANKILRCVDHAFSESFEDADASHFHDADVIFVVEEDPADPAAPLSWSDVINGTPSGNDITLTTGLVGWDNSKKYRVFAQGYGSVQTSQKAKTFQADDADGLVADAREPYGYGHGQQAHTGTLITAAELPVRHVNLAFGDGRALATGYAWDTAKNLNNLVSYKTSPQCPAIYSESATFSGSGTRKMVRATWRSLGRGRLDINRTRKLWVAPRFKSDDGTNCTVRVSLCRNMPRSADPSAPSLMDVVRVGPYTEVSFSTASTSYVVPAADDLDIRHLSLDAYCSGGWLIVEITNHAVFDGLPENWLGPLVSP